MILYNNIIGLAAANELRDQGITNVKILEARDYIGGRSRTLQDYFVEGLATEVGSSWVYRYSAIDVLYNKLGLQWDVSRFNFDTIKLYNEEGALSATDSQQLKSDYTEGFVAYAQEQYYANKDEDIDLSVEELMASYFASSEGRKLPNMHRQAVHAFATPVSTNLGQINDEADASNIIYGLTWEDEELDFTAVPHGGFTPVVNEYAKPIAHWITRNSVVTKINYTRNHTIVEVTTNNGANSGNNLYHTRTVICTVPIGVLQHRDIEFVPDLPDKKWNAIDSIGNGSVNKCIMYWDRTTKNTSWWPEGELDLQLITRADTGSDAWTYFINDQSHATNNEHYVLTAWSAGDIVKELEAETDEQTLARVLVNLRTMFGEAVPEPTKILVTRWLSDPYSRGVHTFRETGVDINRAQRELKRPLEDKVFFAGEAVDHGSNTVAAYNSGIAVAKDVVKALYIDADNSNDEVQEDQPTFQPTLYNTYYGSTFHPTFNPTSLDTSSEYSAGNVCADDNNYRYYQDAWKDCTWIVENDRCNRNDNKSGKSVTEYYCPVLCGYCDGSDNDDENGNGNDSTDGDGNAASTITPSESPITEKPTKKPTEQQSPITEKPTEQQNENSIQTESEIMIDVAVDLQQQNEEINEVDQKKQEEIFEALLIEISALLEEEEYEEIKEEDQRGQTEKMKLFDHQRQEDHSGFEKVEGFMVSRNPRLRNRIKVISEQDGNRFSFPTKQQDQGGD